ncbi:hypothetical protein WJX72_011153 [[Myrmecia] bisecta]|uniref:BSD domain-containing protein n=1 Tax=[Myrmecia] bisecta TaxID=41462 RepID=A0AAW1PY88_9CHLO
MFAQIVSVLQGEAEAGREGEGGAPLPVRPTSPTSQRQAFNFWDVAAAVADTVKVGTADIAASVAETNWRAELQAFSQGVRADTQQLGQRTAAAVEEAVAHLPEDASTALPLLQARGKDVQERVEHVGSSLGRLGQSLLIGTSELFDQVKEAIQAELVATGSASRQPGPASTARFASVNGRYSRFESEVSNMQRDSSTYCDEPEDQADFAAWLQTFDLTAKRPHIEAIIASNAFMAELQSRIVPLIVEYNVFWTRYFYRHHCLSLKHEARLQVAQRAQRVHTELVGWDDEDNSGVPTAAAPTAPCTTSADSSNAPAEADPPARACSPGPAAQLSERLEEPADSPGNGTDGDESSDLSASAAVPHESDVDEDWGSWE